MFDKRVALVFIWKKLRILNTKTQWEIAKMLWYSQAYVSTIFNGDASLTLESLQEFAMKGVWISELEFLKIVGHAKALELKETLGRDITEGELQSIVDEVFGFDRESSIRDLLEEELEPWDVNTVMALIDSLKRK